MPELPFIYLDWPGLCDGPLLWNQPSALIWLCLGAPFLEEWVMRAGLQEFLLRRAWARRPNVAAWRWHDALPATVGTAIVFALLHLGRGWETVAFVLPVGLLIGWVYQQTRDWFVCACAHLAANAFAWLSCQPLTLP